MLITIKRIKGLGVFGDFTAPADLPAFARYNIIYGENGSGKTTLSRLFAALEAGAHADYADLEYMIESQSGALSAGQRYGRKVRTFNADYVEANIGQFHGPLRHILIIGEANKTLAEEAAGERATYDERSRAIAAAERAAEKLEAEKGKVFSAIAKTIGEATSGTNLRSYRKPNAEADFARARDLAPLLDAQLKAHRATVHQEQLECVGMPVLPLQPGDPARPFADVAAALRVEIVALLARTAQAGALRRLVEEPMIARWVEEGVTLHRAHNSDHCEFCAQPLPEARMAVLAEHFGVEDQRLKADIERTARNTRNLLDGVAALVFPAKTSLYAELRADYETAVEMAERCRTALVDQIDAAAAGLDEKLLNRATAYARDIAIDPKPLTAALATLAAVIERHNRKTEGFEREKAEARTQLQRHYLSTIVDQVRDLNAQIAVQKTIGTKLTDGAVDLPDPRSLQALKDSFEAKQAKVSSEHAGGAALTDKLKIFLGRTDLRFEAGAEGYLVQRRGKPAKRLSEGEKTAIAFLYFIVQLGDQDFNTKEGVVVIDDPISSLDAASIYQAFAFLKNAVKDVKQVFILTHNFDFLKLLLNWVQNFKKTDKAYFMVVCAEADECRNASLKPLDALLLDHPTEYCFLFKLLHGFKSDGTILASYHIPNVARKVLETFLDFHRPYEASLHSKLEEIDFDPHKKTAIYKFANDLSHSTGKGFDPALVSETQKNVTYLLEMIKAVSPLHYNGLEKLAGPR
ncbi:wobble nucleotide-excising tRNase [Cereibacter changlensis]|uniref:Wobble nucleotide-excising tRNase n=3 Tax=Cereibacter changlensis TaxID=402884 RepID=A0A2W7QHQ5_9RHOB|nr:AAA family ATPase [Cereibacter changlensis]PZX47621.1 wobble nucleotide-excising tRNase [Cereibacter changlensis]